MVGVNVDVTERREAEEALRAADRRKTEFLAMLSHELRNPMAAMSNTLSCSARPRLIAPRSSGRASSCGGNSRISRGSSMTC
jgi:signal transduction histidine kinase